MNATSTPKISESIPHNQPTAPDHGITVTATATQPPLHQASCLCGFISGPEFDRRRAVQAGRHHVEAETPIGYLPVDNSDIEALTLLASAQDPYFTPCPSWCEANGVHTVESHDCDRYHYGQAVRLPVKDIAAEYYSDGPADSTYTLGHLLAYVRQYTHHAEPRIYVGVNDGPKAAVLTLDEAEAIGLTLLAMVEAAR